MWRKWNVGDKVLYTFNEFDGHGSFTGIITEKDESHLIAEVNGMHLWIDDDTADMFYHR